MATKTKTKAKVRAKAEGGVATLAPRRRAVGFGGLDKRQLNVDIPVELWDRIKAQAKAEGTSKGLLVTEILARWCKIEPSRFGIVTD